MLVKVKENSFVARIAAAKLNVDKVAIVIGRSIHLHHTSRHEFLNDHRWVCHELQHVQQYRQNGLLGFVVLYLVESVRKGYYENRFEAEARNNENNSALMEGVVFA